MVCNQPLCWQPPSGGSLESREVTRPLRLAERPNTGLASPSSIGSLICHHQMLCLGMAENN